MLLNRGMERLARGPATRREGRFSDGLGMSNGRASTAQGRFSLGMDSFDDHDLELIEGRFSEGMEHPGTVYAAAA